MRYVAGLTGSREGLRDDRAAVAQALRPAFCAALFALAALLVTPRAARACTCIADVPLCQSFWQTDAVFTGEVLSFEPANPDQPFSRRVARIRIERTWRGAVEGVVDVITGAGGGDCGYSFRAGIKYVVYAHRARDGSWTTSICSPTKPLEHAAGDLQYFKEMEAPARRGRVFGNVQYESRGGALTPVNGARVHLTGNSLSRTVATGDDGGFEFADVPPGRYEVRVEGSSAPWTAEIRAAHACALVNMWLPRPARVR